MGNYLESEQKVEKDSWRTKIHNTILNNFIVLARITLCVPGATVKKAGTYTTNLNWTLSDTPAN